MISAKPEEQKALFDRLKEIGLNVNSIPDVLSLDKTDYLQRRLQTVLVKKKLARTPKGARQLIVHRKVLVGKNAIDSPSYIVPVDMEDKISLKVKVKKVKEQDSEVQEDEKMKEEKKMKRKKGRLLGRKRRCL